MFDTITILTLLYIIIILIPIIPLYRILGRHKQGGRRPGEGLGDEEEEKSLM